MQLHNSGHSPVCWVLSCRFAEACAAYSQGGRPDLGLAILQQLGNNAVQERRFADAAHSHYMLAMQALQVGHDVEAWGAGGRCDSLLYACCAAHSWLCLF
jgi:hypothetical protein